MTFKIAKSGAKRLWVTPSLDDSQPLPFALSVIKGVKEKRAGVKGQRGD